MVKKNDKPEETPEETPAATASVAVDGKYVAITNIFIGDRGAKKIIKAGESLPEITKEKAVSLVKRGLVVSMADWKKIEAEKRAAAEKIEKAEKR